VHLLPYIVQVNTILFIYIIGISKAYLEQFVFEMIFCLYDVLMKSEHWYLSK